ncbi:Predicted nicotinamide N-methyase [Klenkia marina]|uniref:Predicted nicotinamide N-methyase n=1 Tax=Klenkia marina TaxID=1960309 RepID=A0A1G4YQ61_9ACTN|nr:50S ribosomal protein L11 methyltransferase [Klenkia marina]SCX55569.1 Predicted nicotinamide N-methyase [Klenkia marina]
MTVPAGFFAEHTRLVRTPLVPEVVLHLADDVAALWQAMEDAAGVGEVPGPGEASPFWAAAWIGGQGLARYVLDHPDLVAGRTVLDLGAGSGLVAVAAALAGADRVLASDVDPYALAVIPLNAAANGVRGVEPVGDVLDDDWGGPRLSTVDVVLAGDVFYDLRMADRVRPWLFTGWVRGAIVLVGDPGRSQLPEALVEVAGYDVADSGVDPARRTTVWRLP